jgi:hypothetical protein
MIYRIEDYNKKQISNKILWQSFILYINQQSKYMANPMWVAGSKSANPAGRPRGSSNSATTIRGKLERFVARNYTMNRMNKIFEELSARDQATLYKDLLPYILPKQSPEAINENEIEKLYELVENAIKHNQNRAAI